MNIQKLLTALFLLLTSLQLFSQGKNATLTGTVTADGKPAEYVSVQLKGTSYSTVTNVKGQYTITADAGSYTVVISHLNFKTTEFKVNLKAGSVVIKDAGLEEDSTALNEVQVAGKSTVQRVREQAYNITAVDIRPLHNTSTDLNQVLNRTPGIRVRESGGTGSDFTFSLNGFSGDQVKFFLDGIPIDNYGSAFTLNNMPPNLAERIDIYKGVVPIELGSDALGGAINIVTNKSLKNFTDVSYTYGSFNTHKVSLNTRYTSKNGFVANFNAFGNYSDNDFKVDVNSADLVSGAFGPVKKYRHFHDGYKQAAVMAEAGVKDKTYADYLLFGVMVTGNKKEVQQGATMQRVAGDAFIDNKSIVPTLKYKKAGLFTKNLMASISASYNFLERRSVDTSSAKYNWAGDYVIRPFATSGEINQLKTLAVFNTRSLQSNTNFKYDLTDNQYLAFNHSFVGINRKETEEYGERSTPDNSAVNKHILGLSYNLFAFDKRLSLNVFTKMFNFKTKLDSSTDDSVAEKSSTKQGYGMAAAYFITPEIQLKGSYEYSYRLPAAEEILGDGLLTLPNFALQPEESDNVNAGFAYKKTIDKHTFGLQGNFIYRNAKNFIRPVVTGAQTMYENTANVRVTGFDAVVFYGYSNWLIFEVNATHQKTVNTNKFEQGTNVPDDKNGFQLPNIPIFYGNADLGLKFRNLRSADDLLSLTLSANYNDAYYLKWPALGERNYKRSIPEQFTQNVNLAYSLANGKYNVALECRNITDVKVYDYFSVQKPGRAFFIKLRYYIAD